jgi:hypothetical protein
MSNLCSSLKPQPFDKFSSRLLRFVYVWMVQCNEKFLNLMIFYVLLMVLVEKGAYSEWGRGLR